MAGRHGVPPKERKGHSRQASRQRRRRTQRRDALQPWRLWLALRGVLALIVLAACGWSVLLLTRHQGGIWPVVAVIAGGLSLLMIGLDVRARRRQRAQLRRRAVPRAVGSGGGVAAAEQSAPAQPFVPEPPPRPGRHSHRA
jgi:hypothetical protein